MGAVFERTASVRDQEDVHEVLEAVAHAISDLLGYRVVVVNVYRPAFDDMLTAAAVGTAASLRRLLGTVSPGDTWTPLLARRFERRGAYFLADGEFDWDALGATTYLPDLPPSDDPEAWLAGDALFVPLRDTRGELVGVVSVDEPQTGRRPSDDELDALVTIANHAAVALRIAQATANDMQHQRMLERVLEVSARLAQADDVETVLQAVCDGIEDALGFRSVVIEEAKDRSSPLRTVAANGWQAEEHGMSLAQLEPLFTEEFEVAGCYLLPSEVVEARLDLDDWRRGSELEGAGPHAWARHWLLVPLIDGDRWIGLIRVDDPLDRLLPTQARLQALRLFANQAVAAMGAADQTVRLRHEATHDALTGLPNRRAFRTRLAREAASPEGFALVLCDMDNLKGINDTLGHEAGDLALLLLANALRSGLRRSDEAYRLGGDEFAVVLPAADRLDAERVTQRLREAVAGSTEGPLERIEASFGIGVREEGESPQRLVARVDAALYETKRTRSRAA